MNSSNNTTQNPVVLPIAHAMPSKPLLLSLAILACCSISAPLQAAPTGGTVVGGTGNISQDANKTTINQTTHKLAIDWQSFNVNLDERVEFIQPTDQSLALNRIMDHNGSKILGQVDANGHVILVNPNGIFFGRNATLNVGGLVASGLNIDTSAFLNGELAFSGVDGSAGIVINSGLISAASGGNVALLGKNVVNNGLITAELGHVALAAGSEAVVTFDGDGLLGVRIDKETLNKEVGGNYSVKNAGTIDAAGGKILLNASVSQNLFTQAVNRGELQDNTQAIVHDDGSFTLGAGTNVINRGTLNVSSDVTSDAGTVILAGSTVRQNGDIRANSDAASAGSVYIQASKRIALSRSGDIYASGSKPEGGNISLKADKISASRGASITATGDISITANDDMYLPEIHGHNARITTSDNVRQRGHIELSGDLELISSSDAHINLTNRRNDLTRVSVNAGSGSNIHITESNDIELGDIELKDSFIRINTLKRGATVSQQQGTNMSLTNAATLVRSDNIVLGEGGSATAATGSYLELKFKDSIKLNNSVSLGGDKSTSTARVYGMNQPNLVSIEATKKLDADVSLEELGIEIGSIVADTATIKTINKVTQSGPIELSKRLNLSLKAGGQVELNNPNNQLHSVAMDLGYTSDVNLVNAGDIQLAPLKIWDSTVAITTVNEGATISQQKGANIELSDSHFSLSSDNIILGDSNNSITAIGSFLDFAFAKHFESNQSINLGDIFYFNTGKIRDNSRYPSIIVEANSGLFDATIDVIDNDFDSSNNGIKIGTISADSAKISTLEKVTQSGPIKLSKELDLELAIFGQAKLDHSNNEIHSVTMDLGHSTAVDLFTDSDIMLGEHKFLDASATITSTGHIEQAPDTEIHGGDSSLKLKGSSISLGAAGTSNIMLYSAGILTIDFDDTLKLDGDLLLGGYLTSFNVSGNQNDNTLIVGENASFNMDSYFGNYQVTLGAGNDSLILHSNFVTPEIPYGKAVATSLGEGKDTVTIKDASILYDLQDFDEEEDTLILVNP